MADSLDIDLSEFAALSASLGRASGSMIAEGAKVVAKAALNIKNDTRKNISTHPSWKRLASTVTYDQFGLTADVGYEDRGQGELAGIAEFGSSRHAPHPALYPAAKTEAPRFEKALQEVVTKAIERAL